MSETPPPPYALEVPQDSAQPSSSMENTRRPSFAARIGRKLRRSKSDSPEEMRRKEATARKPGKLQKRGTQPDVNRHEGINELGERAYSIFSEASTLVDERPRDHTEMLHGLAHHGSFDSLLDGYAHIRNAEQYLDEEQLRRLRERNEKWERIVRSVPSDIWRDIASFLDPADAAHLSMANKTLREKLGDEPLLMLALPENKQYRIRFLHHMDRQLPEQLLCFPCGVYHRRIRIGNEKLKADYVSHPLYFCPLVFSTILPRMRLAHGRDLPYSFIQLATRRMKHSRHHGIHPDTLSRRWKDEESGWSHQTRYMVHDDRLLMRVRSQVFAPPKLTQTGERYLLFDRENYVPFFSVCAHWRDGELIPICKCALSHIPESRQSYLRQLQKAPVVSRSLNRPNFLVKGCEECRPARRCPECPTEYLVEVSMVEDKDDPITRFKHALVVTRWSDLGDGSSPTASPEYCAINGIKSDYDSFSHVGRRAVAGIFESRNTGTVPGQRMISLNPKNKKLGEEGHGWY